MNIVVLDGYTLNPGDLSWEELNKLGNTKVYDRTRSDEIVERAADAEVVLTNKTPLDAETIDKLTNLKYIGVLATGYNVVDVKAAAERGILVTNIPDYSTRAVAQLVFAFMLEHCHHVQKHTEAVLDGGWVNSPDFSFTRYPLLELADKTIGIIGFGQIGQQVARIADSFGMSVIAHSRTQKQLPGLEFVRYTSIEQLLQSADFITVHCALTPDTSGLINKEKLKLMKRDAFFINTARGGIVVEHDLADALNEGSIAGAGLDVLSTEPPKPENPLLTAKNCFITPHIAWATKEARTRLMGIAVANIRSFLDGHPQNAVNVPK